MGALETESRLTKLEVEMESVQQTQQKHDERHETLQERLAALDRKVLLLALVSGGTAAAGAEIAKSVVASFIK